MSLLLARANVTTNARVFPPLVEGTQVFGPQINQTVAPPLVSETQIFAPIIPYPNNSVKINSSNDGLKLNTISGATFTMLAWVRLVVDRNAFSCVLSYESVGSGNYNQLCTDADGTSLVVFDYAALALAVGTLVPNTWHKVGFSVSGTTVRAWFGTEGTPGVSAVSATIAPVSSPDYQGIGSSIFDEWFNGRMAGARVWNAVLTDAEIELEFQSYLPVKTADLLGAWLPRDMLLSGVLTAISGANLSYRGASGTTIEPGPIVVQALLPGLESSGTIYAPVVIQSGAGTQTLLPSLEGPTAVTYAPTLTNLNTLVASFVTSTATTYAPSVVQVVAPSFVSAGSQTYAPTLTNLNTLLVGFLSSGEQLYAPVVAQFTLLAPSLFGPTSTTYAPTLTNLNTLLPSLVGPTATTYAPSVVQVVQPSFLASGAQTFSPSIVQIVTPGLYSGTQLFAPALTNLNTLLVGFLSAGSQTYAPVVSPVTTLQPSLFGPTAVTYAPTVIPGTVTLTTPAVGPTATTFAPSVVQVVAPSFVSSGAQTFAPSAVQVVKPSLVGPTATTYAPTVVANTTLTVPFVASAAQFFGPSLVQVVSAPFVGSGTQTFAPVVLRTEQLVAPFVPSAEQFFGLVVSGLNFLIVPPYINPSQDFAPSVVQIVQPPVTVSGQIYQNTVVPSLGWAGIAQKPIPMPLLPSRWKTHWRKG